MYIQQGFVKALVAADYTRENTLLQMVERESRC